ncbi:hypothetical protein, partial [Enterobacter kobei]|uniref:hypothetical protein n=1 Tax=Enterobacter kobei TaxID=208224 RepID=UPI00195AB403
FGFAENTDDLFVGKTLLHGDVLMWLMKTLLTSGCTNQRGAGQLDAKIDDSSINELAASAAVGAESVFSGLASDMFSTASGKVELNSCAE